MVGNLGHEPDNCCDWRGQRQAAWEKPLGRSRSGEAAREKPNTGDHRRTRGNLVQLGLLHILTGVDKPSLCRLSRAVTLLTGVILLAGCARIDRTMTITSEPSGALVYLNGHEIGRTPVTHDFTWYGKYDVQVRKEGYLAYSGGQRVAAPWWQWMPLDLFASMVPARLVDHHDYAYKLVPEPEAGTNVQLMPQAAFALRTQLESGQYTRKPPTQPASTKPASTQPATQPATTAPAQ